MSGKTLKEKTAHGLFWGGMWGLVQQGLGLAFGIVLGRLLSPHDYGMTAMISVFALIAGALQESGFKSAIANLPEASHRDYNAVFWFSTCVATVCYAVLFFLAPLIARYYHEPALVALCRYAFLGIIVNSLGTAHAAYLFRNLMVKEQAKCGMAAVVVSNVVGVSMAVAGCAYWSLATQTIVFVLVNTMLLWHYAGWHPTLSFSFEPIRRMFGFSSKLLATTILTHLNSNVMNILLGRYFKTSEVGSYNQAYQWNYKVVYLLQGMLQQVAQPVLHNAGDERQRQLRILRKMVRFAAFLSFPLLWGFSLVAQEFIVLTIGEKWLFSASLLQLQCISGAFLPVCAVLSNMLISRGKSSIYFWTTASLCAVLVATMVGLHQEGIRTMVTAYVLIYVGWTFVWHFFVWRVTGYRLVDFLRDIVPFAMIAAVVMAATWLLTRGIAQVALLLGLRVVVAALLYYAVLRLLRATILLECQQFFISKLRREP